MECIPSTESRRVGMPVWLDMRWGKAQCSSSSRSLRGSFLSGHFQLRLATLLIFTSYFSTQIKPDPEQFNQSIYAVSYGSASLQVLCCKPTNVPQLIFAPATSLYSFKIMPIRSKCLIFDTMIRILFAYTNMVFLHPSSCGMLLNVSSFCRSDFWVSIYRRVERRQRW